MTPEKKIERLIKILELTNEDYASKSEVREVIASFVSFLKELKSQVDTSLNTTTGNVTSNMTKFEKQLLGRLDTITKSLKEELVQRSRDELYAETQRLSTQLRADLEVVRSLIPTVPDLSPLAARIEDVAKAIPTLPPEKLGEDYRNALEALQGDDRLDKSAIRGFDDLEKELRASKDVQLHAAGGGRGFYLYVDGVKKGIMNTVNFKSGSNMSISYAKTNGLDTLTFTASGTGGISIETPTGTVNASNTVFTVSATPQYMVADGTTYFENSGYTRVGTTITFDVPPSQYVRAII